MRVAVYRKAHFNAAHRLFIPEWGDTKNLEVFGPCSNPNYHGHNYDIEVKVVGEVDPVTGMVIDLKILKEIIKDEVEDRFDHKNLNLDTEDFKDIQPTTENICYVIWSLLSNRLGDQYDITVRLYETPRNFVEFPV